MTRFEDVWRRIERFAGEEFRTIQGKTFTYVVPGAYLRVFRDGRQINRVLSRENFAKATQQMPADRPSLLSDRQGPSYTWAILMDPRVRGDDW